MGGALGFFIFTTIISSLNAYDYKTSNAALLKVIDSKDQRISYLHSAAKPKNTPKIAKALKGKFIVTSYCGCNACCGEYAKSRPKLGNRPLIVTAGGSIAEEGVTIATDPKIIPLGSKVYIEGVGVRVAQDTGGAIVGNRIDVYYSNHGEALKAGLNDRPREVYIF